MEKRELLRAIRQLINDRFAVPVFYLKNKPGSKLYITKDNFRIKDSSFTNSVELVEGKQEDDIFFASFKENSGEPYTPYLEELATTLIEEGFPIAYTGYFRGVEPSSILNIADADLQEDITICSKQFYSEETILNFCLQYFEDVLKMQAEVSTVEDMLSYIDSFIKKTLDHMILYVSIMLTEYRMFSEYKASVTGAHYSDGSGELMAGVLGIIPSNINISIGSVFSMSDAVSSNTEHFSENWNLPGSDNILGNKNSIWYRQFCILRDQLEQRYKDFTFRKDTGMWSKIQLDKPLNYRSYFDSYPFTISPQPRQVIK
jgi:hypothetical protein